MAKYDYTTPEDILRNIRKKKKEGYYVNLINDRKFLAQWYENIIKDKKKTKEVYDRIRNDLKKPFIKLPKGELAIARFLREQQDKNTGSWVEQPTRFNQELERARHIISTLTKYDLKPKYPLKFIDRVNTSKKLKTYFKSLLFDPKVNHEDELNLGFVTLKSFYDQKLHKFSKDWLSTYYECINIWQDPKTGYWGPWIKRLDKIKKLPELSITFHILEFFYDPETLALRNKKYYPKYKKKIIKTTWEISNKNYGYGWLERGYWSTHHNFDVAYIFVLLFDIMNQNEKNSVRRLFNKFLEWCLGKCQQENGGFIGVKPETKEANYFETRRALSFLEKIGYFDEVVYKRIWMGVNLRINSYRIYNGDVPDSSWDTKQLSSIIYTKYTKNPDPIETRDKIRFFLETCKAHKDSDSLRIKKRMFFDKFLKTNYRVLFEIPELEKNQFLITVDRYGGIIWKKGNDDILKK